MKTMTMMVIIMIITNKMMVEQVMNIVDNFKQTNKQKRFHISIMIVS